MALILSGVNRAVLSGTGLVAGDLNVLLPSEQSQRIRALSGQLCVGSNKSLLNDHCMDYFSASIRLLSQETAGT